MNCYTYCSRWLLHRCFLPVQLEKIGEYYRQGMMSRLVIPGSWVVQVTGRKSASGCGALSPHSRYALPHDLERGEMEWFFRNCREEDLVPLNSDCSAHAAQLSAHSPIHSFIPASSSLVHSRFMRFLLLFLLINKVTDPRTVLDGPGTPGHTS